MKESRIHHIDGLRAVAVLAVVLFHTGVHSAGAIANPYAPLAFILRQSAHGVDLFFVLSGFCLAYPALSQLAKSGHSDFAVSRYAARRVVRILPPYYAAIAVFAVAGIAYRAVYGDVPVGIASDGLSAGAILHQLLFLDREPKYLDGSFWTLAIEFRWYFVFPIALWLWTRSPKAFGAVWMAAVVATATSAHSVDLTFLPTFMLGIVAADLYARRVSVVRAAALGAAVAGGLAMLSNAGGGWYFQDAGPLWGIAMFCFVVLIGSLHILRGLLANKWPVTLGLTSYSVYLVHEPIVAIVEARIPGVFAACILSVAAAIAAGGIFWIAFERPWTDGVLKRRAVDAADFAVTSAFVWLRLPSGIVLQAQTEPSKIVKPFESAGAA